MDSKEKTFLKDYKPPAYLIKHIELDIILDYAKACVTSTLSILRNSETPENTDLILDGENLTLKNVEYKYSPNKAFKNVDFENGKNEEIFLQNENLVIKGKLLPKNKDDFFYLKTIVFHSPQNNTQLMGLYKSHDILCTQCEAQGFRRITYFIDRPDVMATFKTVLKASKKKFPLLLTNGNLESTRDNILLKNVLASKFIHEFSDTETVLHEATFLDPFPKPCYLFAIVAGDLEHINDTFKTCSGKNIKLNLWCEPKDKNKLDWSLQCLKKAMRWDEETFGREFDLNTFHLVAIPHFNMGAMENKGLNLFNSTYLLASKETGTDTDFENCLSTVSHEYFHNWTGNRITCRDWFQLVVKEGLTTYREQLFAEDQISPTITRINVVDVVKSLQFTEDAGPLSHPIVPHVYKQIDNCYTITIYRKGPEVIRMYTTMLGKAGFRKGMDLYFERHDGEPVTYQQFHQCILDANPKYEHIMNQFILWYQQQGTPVVTVLKHCYVQEKKQFCLVFKQERPDDPKNQNPLVIPIRLGLIGKTSKKDLLPEEHVLIFHKQQQEFLIDNITEDCIPSILRNFSAPVQVEMPGVSIDVYGFLMANDSDPINQWDAAQRLFTQLIFDVIDKIKGKDENYMKSFSMTIDEFPALKIIHETFSNVFKAILDNEDNVDKYFLAHLITLPSQHRLMKDMKPCDPEVLDSVYCILSKQFYETFKHELAKAYHSLVQKSQGIKYTISPKDVGHRHLKNRLLSYLNESGDHLLAYKQYELADNMTDRYAALVKLAEYPDTKETKFAFDSLLQQAKTEQDTKLLQKWFQAQAISKHPNVLNQVKALTEHESFDIGHPNLIRSLLFVFTRNLKHFHRSDGQGYKFIGEMIKKIDPINSQSASSLAESLMLFKTLTTDRQQIISAVLKDISNLPGLSGQTSEIVSKILQ